MFWGVGGGARGGRLRSVWDDAFGRDVVFGAEARGGGGVWQGCQYSAAQHDCGCTGLEPFPDTTCDATCATHHEYGGGAEMQVGSHVRKSNMSFALLWSLFVAGGPGKDGAGRDLKYGRH
jgi:hypothetical protein